MKFIFRKYHLGVLGKAFLPWQMIAERALKESIRVKQSKSLMICKSKILFSYLFIVKKSFQATKHLQDSRDLI